MILPVDWENQNTLFTLILHESVTVKPGEAQVGAAAKNKKTAPEEAVSR
jgi:hypothetical protein